MRCRECGYYSPRWLGRCPGCGAWHSFAEEEKPEGKKRAKAAPPQPLSEVAAAREDRFPSGFGEVDRVLGGGIVAGSAVLVGGDPGIGKSTLLLQVARLAAGAEGTALYISGEESARQVRLRAERLGAVDPRVYLLCATDLEEIAARIGELAPRVAVIDSIQTVFLAELGSVPGSVVQVRECALRLTRLAKETGTAVFLVGHVTKEGVLAGPRVLEHIVDTVLYLEGEKHQSLRILRGVKNRFGSTNEIGLFEMGPAGLVEVTEPGTCFLSRYRDAGVPGTAVVPSIEGTRPVLVEIQALVCPTGYGTPRRMTAGVDYNRVVLLAAVLEKRVGLYFSTQDIYVNAVGGVRLSEPAVDLAVAVALASSFRDVPSAPRTAVVGEVGLTGEVRPVAGIEKRVREAARLGFTSVVLPAANLPVEAGGVVLHGVKTLQEALDFILAS
ncbi:MAG: DNA repair protein RadA [Bacillota bacterium]